jgi:RNA polymerase-associated protein CTR9
MQYEAAVAKDKGRDPQVLACLGRVWLLKGKQEKNIASMKRSLEYSQQVRIFLPVMLLLALRHSQ